MPIHEMLPNEMWGHIFEFVGSPSDMLQTICTCRRFHAIGMRILPRNLQWLDSVHTVQNLRYWERERRSYMFDIPRILTLAHYDGHPDMEAAPPPMTQAHGFNDFHLANTGMLWSSSVPLPNQLPFSFDDDQFDDRIEDTLVARNDVMGRRISSFTLLQELNFFDTTLPVSVYEAIFRLPKLQRLSIEYCTIPPIPGETPLQKFTSLPITELTLRCFSVQRSRMQIVHMLSPFFLATAPNIHTLRIGWTRKSAQFFSYTDNHVIGPNGSPLTYQLPTGIMNLEIRMPHEHLWPKQESVSRTLYTDPLAAFLRNCPTVCKFTLINRVPTFHIADDALPDLQSFTGPLSAMYSMLSRPLDHIEVTDPIRYHQPFTAAMEQISTSRPQLRSLSVLLPQWEDEVMHVISQLFFSLQELTLSYVVQNPTEYTLLSMGHHFLYRLPELRVVRVFKPVLLREINQNIGERRNLDRDIYTVHDTDLGPGAGPDEDVREYIVTWRKPCPNLREVQFDHRFKWRKSWDKNGWTKVTCKDPPRKVTEAMELRWGLSA